MFGYTEKSNYIEKTHSAEFALQCVSTKKIFPGYIFDTVEEAMICKSKRSNPDNWNIVMRSITYSDWSVVGNEGGNING